MTTTHHDERTEALQRGRDAYAAHAWNDAFEALSIADAHEPLAIEDLARLALGAGLTGRHDALLATWERLYEAQLAAGEPLDAAMTAFMIGQRLLGAGSAGRASGWLTRSQRLVDAHDGACAVAGYLRLIEAERALRAGDLAQGLAIAIEAAAVAERFGERDLLGFARYLEGNARLRMEQLDRALPLLDEAMLAASSGELSPIATGMIYCSVIACCQQVYALERSREWTAALSAWCQAQPQLVTFTGSCQLHQAEILELGGAWRESLDQARRCAERFGGAHAGGVAGDAFYQQAEIHRLRGEHAEAEEAYRAASERGRDPQPGLSLLRLAQGQHQAASAAIRAALSASAEPLKRARLLPAALEIMLACRAIDDARGVCDELEQTAARTGGEVLGAIATAARGALHLAEGDAAKALGPLRSAFATWQRLDAPYIAARLRVSIGQACAALGDADGAALERAAARAVFERLGAVPDLSALEAAADAAPTTTTEPAAEAVEAIRERGLTPRELEVLHLVAAGKTNRAIAKQLCVSEKTVDRHVSNLLAKLDLGSRAAATAWAYEHGIVERGRG